jgi:CelD/BcsL family acetyltransferase involved in cellulose biosynthesis
MTPKTRMAHAEPAQGGSPATSRSQRATPDTTTDVDAVTDPLWERLVTAHRTTVFHSPRWLRVLADTYGFSLRARLLSDETGTPSAGVVYAPVDDFMDPRLVSLPFSDFCDPVAGDADQWRTLIEDLVAQRRRIVLRCLHNDLPLRDDRFAVVGRALWHAIDVAADEEQMWQGLPSAARRALRKAQSSGVSVRRASTEADLRAFYELHLRVRKYKYGLLAQPYRFFSSIWEQFLVPGHGVLLLAFVDELVVGGVLFLEWQGVLYYKFNASHLDHLAARPNDRVLWEGISYARERGLQRVDFGLTDADQDGLVRYKRKYATEEKTITLLRHHPPGSPSARDQRARRMLRDLTRVVTDQSVPDSASEQAGDVLYRYFS